MLLKRKAYIRLKYCYVFRENEKFKVVDTFQINIQKGRKIWSMGNLDVNDTKSLIDALVKAKKNRKNLELEKNLGCGAYQTIKIPKWAMQDLIEQIYNCIGYTMSKEELKQRGLMNNEKEIC